jgi:hypothetical protein
MTRLTRSGHFAIFADEGNHPSARLGPLADQVAVAALLGAAIHQPKGAASVDYVARSNLARLRAPHVFTTR